MATDISNSEKVVRPGIDPAIDQRLLLPTSLSTSSTPSWTFILVLISLPAIAPFILACWTCSVVKERVAGPKNCCLRLILAKKCIASCACGSGACLATPFVFLLCVLCGPAIVLTEWGRTVQISTRCVSRCVRLKCVWVVCGLCLSPIVAAGLLCGLLFAPICGLILGLLKLVGCSRQPGQTDVSTIP